MRFQKKIFLSFPDKESNGLVRNGGYYGDELGFPGRSYCKESACNAGDLGSIPGLGSSPGGGHGNPLQYSCWSKPMDRGAWQATVHGAIKELDTTSWLNIWCCYSVAKSPNNVRLLWKRRDIFTSFPQIQASACPLPGSSQACRCWPGWSEPTIH